jgi:hypothetical protein
LNARQSSGLGRLYERWPQYRARLLWGVLCHLGCLEVWGEHMGGYGRMGSADISEVRGPPRSRHSGVFHNPATTLHGSERVTLRSGLHECSDTDTTEVQRRCLLRIYAIGPGFKIITLSKTATRAIHVVAVATSRIVSHCRSFHRYRHHDVAAFKYCPSCVEYMPDGYRLLFSLSMVRSIYSYEKYDQPPRN